MFAGPIHQKMKTDMGDGKDGKAVSGFCNRNYTIIQKSDTKK